MKGIHIPPAALEAGAKELAMNCRCELACDWRDHMDDARAAFVAMVEAWPGAKRVKGYFTHDADYYEPALILPITETSTKENNNG